MRKILSLILTFCLIFSLTACGNNTSKDNVENSSKEETNIEETSVELNSTQKVLSYKPNIKENLKDDDFTKLAYYYNSYVYINGFYKGFYFVSDAIEDCDEDLFNIYMSLMKDYRDKIFEQEVPSYYEEAHQFLMASMDTYVSGIEDLYKAHLDSNYELYVSSSDDLFMAEDYLDTFLSLIEEDVFDVSTLLKSFLQNEYYFDLVDVYDYDELFTDNENNILFTIEREIKSLASLKDDLILAALNKESTIEKRKELEEVITSIEDLNIEDENLLKYREAILPLIRKYVDLIFNFVDDLESNTYNKENISKYKEESDNLNYQIYVSFQGMSDFYLSYDIDVGFEAALEQTLKALETGNIVESE